MSLGEAYHDCLKVVVVVVVQRCAMSQTWPSLNDMPESSEAWAMTKRDCPDSSAFGPKTPSMEVLQQGSGVAPLGVLICCAAVAHQLSLPLSVELICGAESIALPTKVFRVAS